MHRVHAGLPVRELSDAIIRSTTAEDWQWLIGLCFGEFTTRLWIIQEQLLNPEICFLQGPKVYDWDTVASITSLWYLMLLPEAPLNLYWIKNMSHVNLPSGYIAQSIFLIWIKRNLLQPAEYDLNLINNMARIRFRLKAVAYFLSLLLKLILKYWSSGAD
jgi:hypothetical protein